MTADLPAQMSTEVEEGSVYSAPAVAETSQRGVDNTYWQALGPSSKTHVCETTSSLLAFT
jgi:hypothetical protein